MVSLAIIFEELDEEAYTDLINLLPEALGNLGYADAKYLKFPETSKRIVFELADIMEKHKVDTARILTFNSPIKISGREVGGIILVEKSLKSIIDTLLDVENRPDEPIDLVDKSTNCIECGDECDKIGDTNAKDILKCYCCSCYTKVDKKFKKDKWCQTCTDRANSEEEKEK